MNAPPRMTLAPWLARRISATLFNLVAILDAARSGHHDHFGCRRISTSLDLDHGAAGSEMAAGQLVRRHDAVAFLDAFHHFELDGIDVAHRSDAAEHRVHHARRTMDDKAHRHQSIDYFLDLGFLGPFLHDNEHELRLSYQYSETGRGHVSARARATRNSIPTKRFSSGFKAVRPTVIDSSLHLLSVTSMGNRAWARCPHRAPTHL